MRTTEQLAFLDICMQDELCTRKKRGELNEWVVTLIK